MQPQIYLNHIGFLCNAKKTFVVDDCSATRFEVQDMGIVETEALGDFENWKIVFEGQLEKSKTEMGNYLTGDFTRLNIPGIYRVLFPEVDTRSFQFIISDGAFTLLPRMFLDFVHNWRSGDFENEFRGPSHLDDGIRSDTGEQLDVSGGWYDAGDLRKWMTTANMPALGFLNYYEKIYPDWNHFSHESIADNDLITETTWGITFILKMQEKNTGMFFEEIGGGGYGRQLEGMTWWYENHSGCMADNSENRFTDNIPNSGDERKIRVDYNPIVQYTSIYILLRAARQLQKYDPDLAEQCIAGAKAGWEFTCQKAVSDQMHTWTATISWRALASIEMNRHDLIEKDDVDIIITDLLSLQDKDSGFWYMDQDKKDPYRGILHSAQPLIALAEYMRYYHDSSMYESLIHSLNLCWDKYITKMISTNPFGFMPYGTWYSAATEEDHFRQLNDRFVFRFFMPDCSPQRINHGLGGHWSSWAHAMVLIGKLLNDQKWLDAAWDQLYWLWGGNIKNSCFVTGIGYNNPMPHSRFLGTYPGGFSVGFRGNARDEAVLDLDRRAEWSTTEYWNIPLANSMMALAELLPGDVNNVRKIGKA
ncbi:glycoside hydrolase family 9 protein [Bacteroidota bacterium]